MAEEKFRLPQSSYEELVKIIKGYGSLSKKMVVPQEVGQVTGIHLTIISRNNAFLLTVGIIEGGKKKQITEKGDALARALEHEMPEDITNNWRVIVLSNDFIQKIYTAIKIRKGMDANTLQSHIAYSAGEPKNKGIMTGANAIIDILRAAGLIKEKDGKIVAVTEELTDNVKITSPYQEQAISEFNTKKEKDLISAPVATLIGTKSPISIQIQIQCTAEEIETLGPKIKSLIKQISNSNVPEENS